jgi:hypothetical protein
MKPLLLRFASEIVRLPVVKGDAQYGGLAGGVCLELRQSVRFVAKVLGHRGETSTRRQTDREDVAVPWFKPELSASSLNFHNQRVAFRTHHSFAEARVREVAGEWCERGRGARLVGPGELLSHALVLRPRGFKRLRHVIDGRIAKEPIENP